ncbi:MAG: phosphatidate cytidylyltransferase [Clostridia bacterium]|nr:phosphatidate cytidylyltransferase [Clostridia bacterium]
MKIRLISGTCYIALLAGFFCLKIFLPYGDFYFDALIYAFALLGTFEMLRATKDKTTSAERGFVYAFSALCIPACAFGEYFKGWGFAVIGVGVLLLAVALLALLVVRHEETSLEGLGISLLSAIYPTVFLALMVIANHATAPLALKKFGFDSRLLILFVFVVSPCADSIAYVFGKFLRKYFPKKMTPVISPNKTVIGGIGGLVGGMLGAAALYFIYNAAAGSFDQMHIWLPVYLAVGLAASVATAFGDLVESCIKRKLGLKDMGNIMPGHGGALDRLDSALYSTIVAYLAFVIIVLVV